MADLRDTLLTTGGDEKTDANRKQIQENKANLNDAESKVWENKQKLYAERAFIEENRQRILKNYAASFMGNRQMANQNTDDIFRNRKTIVKSIKAEGAVQLNFVESHLNRARIDAIEHRAEMNTAVADVNEKLVEINGLLEEVNQDIMAGNKNIVEFNGKHLDVNTKVLSGEMKGEDCTPDANAARIADNKKRLEEVNKMAVENATKCDEVLAKAKGNREKIVANSDEILSRRQAIEENHAKIFANSEKIAENILKVEPAAVSAAAATEKTEDNIKAILANKAALHVLESKVYENKQKLYAERAFIEENRAMILENYCAAFMGNRQMANQNTEDIFRNRKQIVKNIKVTDAVTLNYFESHLNRARVDAIEHRAGMNAKVAAVNDKMCAINTKLMEVNAAVMAGNAKIVDFNSKHVEVNNKLLSGELMIAGDACTPEANAKRIAENTARIAAITEKAKSNAAKCAEVLEKAKGNRETIKKDSEEIYQRRAAIEENHVKIAANAGKISEYIRNPPSC